MDPVEINDPEKIQEILKGVTLAGEGFVTACLLEDVWDAGLTYPDYFKAAGEDPTASLNGVSPAWETYHLRQGKKSRERLRNGVKGSQNPCDGNPMIGTAEPKRAEHAF